MLRDKIKRNLDSLRVSGIRDDKGDRVSFCRIRTPS